MLFAAYAVFVRTNGPPKVPLPAEQKYEQQTAPLPQSEITPPPQPQAETVSPPQPTQGNPASSSPLPAEVNLAIPFTTQAPFANWDEVHEDLCEEAAALMAASFVLNQPITGPDDAEQKLQAVKTFEEGRFGYYKDTTAEETAVILREHFGVQAVSLVYDPTITQIKETVAQGKAVVVPAAGRELGNPYFTPPGPLYHMLVVKGYTNDGRFITNEPGTRRGANYLYDPAVLFNAIHDWNGGDVANGRKVMIVVG